MRWYGEKQIRLRQNYPLSWWRLFNLSLSTLGIVLDPTREGITSEKLILLTWAKDSCGGERPVSDGLMGADLLVILSQEWAGWSQGTHTNSPRFSQWEELQGP